MPNIFQYFGQKEQIPDELLREADDVFLECAGGVKNGRVKGLGNLSLEYTSGSVSHTMPNEVLTQQLSQLSEENSRLREDLSAVRDSLAEEKQRAAEERATMQAEITRIAQLVQGFLPTQGGA